MPIKPAGPKAYYGNNTSLYKLYFTAELGEAEEPVGSNVAVEFAKLMLPEINRSLFPERYPSVERATETEAAADFGDEALDADEFPAAEASDDADAAAEVESILN
ncbi:MAG TPA: hypothetical protein PKC18_10945 [Lacipirellulaceae bacterium]|nr:hypothetical protein [Lacipirellulaceae bacterium]